MVHSERGKREPTSNSILTGSVCVVQPNRVASRAKWVSTVMPGTPNALPSTTFAVFLPTPGSVTRSFRRRGTSAVPVAQRLAERDEVGRLGPVEPGRLDDLFHVFPVGRGVVGGGLVPREKHRRHHVDPLVGGLRGQDGRDE